MLGKPRRFGIEAIAIGLRQVILFAFGESGLPGKGRFLKARAQRRWSRRRFSSTWPATRCNTYHARREINLSRTQCAVRLLLSPAIPVEPYAVIAGLPLPLAIHTYWPSLVAFDLAAFAGPVPSLVAEDSRNGRKRRGRLEEKSRAYQHPLRLLRFGSGAPAFFGRGMVTSARWRWSCC
jgi:hypothetical protein